MPTSYVDQFYLMDPANPPSVGSTMTSVSYTLTDQNNDGDIDRFSGDSINGIDIVNSWPGDTVKVTLPDGSAVTYVGTTFYLQGGGRVLRQPTGRF